MAHYLRAAVGWTGPVYFSPGALAWLVGDRAGLFEGELEGAEAVAERGGVMVAEARGGGVQEAGQRVDQ